MRHSRMPHGRLHILQNRVWSALGMVKLCPTSWGPVS